jgi:hypothetical protein
MGALSRRSSFAHQSKDVPVVPANENTISDGESVGRAGRPEKEQRAAPKETPIRARTAVPLRSIDAAAALVYALLATVGRLRLLSLLCDVRGCPRALGNAAFKIGGLLDRFRGKPRELLGILIVAVLTRLQCHGQQPGGAVAQTSGVVITVGHQPNNDRFARFVA